MMAPFIKYVTLNPKTVLDVTCFPGSLPFTKALHLDFRSPVTFFVGENGSGKSTLLEAIAVLAGLPITGGGTNEIGESHDEPESALSPQRQLALLALMNDLVRGGNTQFIVATHSPILLTYPGSIIVSFDSPTLEHISLTDTKHYQITHGILTRPESYWKHLRDSDADPTDG